MLKIYKHDGTWEVVPLTNDELIEIENDSVQHPSHYCDGGIEVIDFDKAKLTLEEFIGLCKGNVFKYVARAGKKDKCKIQEDLMKARQYLDFAIARLEEEDEKG